MNTPVLRKRQMSDPRPINTAVSTRTQRTLGRTPSSGAASTFNSYDNVSMSSLYQHQFVEIEEVEINGADVLLVSEKVSEWQVLLRHLMAPEDTGYLIEQIEGDSRSRFWSAIETCARALNEWKKRKGSQATVQRLCHALKEIKRRDVSDRLLGNHVNTGPDHLDTPSSVSSTASSFVYLRMPVSPCDGDVFKEFDEEAETNGLKSQMQAADDLKKVVNKPKKAFISLAGPPKSGKTTILRIFQTNLRNDEAYGRSRIVTVQGSGKESVSWLARKIVEEITREPQSDEEVTKYAIRALRGLLTANDDVILILDISLTPWSDNCKQIFEFLLQLRKDMKLCSKLKIVASAITSVSKTSLFLQNRTSSEELHVPQMTEEDATDFIKSNNDGFSLSVARAIVPKIERFPFYLERIADAEMEDIFVVDNKEDLLRFIEANFQEIDPVFGDAGNTDALKMIVNHLNEDERKLLAQILTFTCKFNIEQANLIVDSKTNIEDSSFSVFCEQGTLFLKRERNRLKETTYVIPYITGNILRNVLKPHESLAHISNDAEIRHQNLFLDLLVLLSDCFMGKLPSAEEELRILEPFTPSDGVPAELSVILCNENERITRVVKQFRDHRDDILQSLKVCNETRAHYSAALNVATKLNVYYFLRYMLSFLETLAIYRKLKREARNYADAVALPKLNVFIASFKVDSNGPKRFMSEAKSLYQASCSSLSENQNSDGGKSVLYAHCMQKMGACMFAESMRLDETAADQLFAQGLETLKTAKDVFREEAKEKNVYSAECGVIESEFLLEKNQTKEAERLIESSIETLNSKLGSRHPLTCSARLIKCKIDRINGLPDDANAALDDILDAEESVLGQHWQTARSLYEKSLCRYNEILEDRERNIPELPTTPRCLDSGIEANAGDFSETGLMFMRNDSTLSGCASPTLSERSRSETIKIADLFERDLQSLAKKAAKCALHANGKCEDACECFMLLAKISKLLGQEDEAQKYTAKAHRCVP